MTAIVMQGDARALPLADASVDLIVTSPPYFGLRSYTDGGEHYDGQIGAEPTPAAYVDALIDCTREWMRVLKPTGSIWVNLGDSYYSGKGSPGRATVDAKNVARTDRRERRSPLDYGLPFPRKTLLGIPWRYGLRCLDDLGLIIRAEVIWRKSNAMPESVTDRVRRSHETWFHLTVQPRYYAALDEIREEPSGYQRPNGAGRAPRGGQKPRKMLDTCNPAGKVPGSVWDVPTRPLHVPEGLGVDHFAAFPIEWPRRIISGWSPPDGVVVDPFAGTGTTALAADALGRTGICVEASADYCRIARWRTTDPGERARALGVPKPPKQLSGQVPLFDLGSTT